MTNRGSRRNGAKADRARQMVGDAASRRGFTLIELLVVVGIISILAAIVLPNYTKLKEKAKEAEGKASIHNIQLSLERFAVDNQGEYPPYLIGGDNTALVMHYGAKERRSVDFIEIPEQHTSDPLIRTGYLDSYAANPFVRNPQAVQRLQADVGDPLRSSAPDGREFGTRFGAQSNLIGQTLCEARYIFWLYHDQETDERINEPTWANIQYKFYDIWGGTQRRRAHLPGSFMYKVIGEIVAQSDSAGDRENVKVDDQDTYVPKSNLEEATYPVSLTNYVLSTWGGYRTKGLDILGEEPLVIFSFANTRRVGIAESQFIYDPSSGRYELAPARTVDKFMLLGVPSWTRGVNRSHVGPLWGSPYGPSNHEEEQLTVGNANGYRDGLIMVLTAGENSAMSPQ